MNKQGREVNGKVIGGIEWTKTVLPDGTEKQGFTWNPIAGCKHGCRWVMPDGSTAICYAEAVAENVARRAYQFGFDHHYWRPQMLDEPLKLKEPARIFLDSMSDLMGAWVPEDQIKAVLQVCRQASWHQFQLLTKNAPRLARFVFPENVWVGVSSAPDVMLGRELNRSQQERYMHKALATLSRIDAAVTWMSFEPLSWDVAGIVAAYPDALDWAVIGAASNGPRYYQPDHNHIQHLLWVLDDRKIPVFFKGNLTWKPWREEFPQPTHQPAPEARQPALF